MYMGERGWLIMYLEEGEEGVCQVRLSGACLVQHNRSSRADGGERGGRLNSAIYGACSLLRGWRRIHDPSVSYGQRPTTNICSDSRESLRHNRPLTRTFEPPPTPSSFHDARDSDSGLGHSLHVPEVLETWEAFCHGVQ